MEPSILFNPVSFFAAMLAALTVSSWGYNRALGIKKSWHEPSVPMIFCNLIVLVQMLVILAMFMMMLPQRADPLWLHKFMQNLAIITALGAAATWLLLGVIRLVSGKQPLINLNAQPE